MKAGESDLQGQWPEVSNFVACGYFQPGLADAEQEVILLSCNCLRLGRKAVKNT